MIKKLSITALLAGAFLLNTGFSHDTNIEVKNQVQHKVYEMISTGDISKSNIQDFLDKWMENHSIKNPSKEEESNTTDNNKQENAENADQATETPESNTNETEQAPEQNTNNSTETNVEENTEDQATESNEASDISQFEQEVIDLTNVEREKQGLSPLTLDTELSKVAKAKSQDMASKGYFSHNSPTYGSPFDMMEQFGISYQTAGENIAKGQTTPEEVVKAWMNSEGHRANILNEDFTHIGVGYVEDGNYWTQQFIGK
ncbi:CAP domain-containing protein [Gracilibacillus caseinilyticus]|uniref:CAP domain-containing protein n=1 Tax=Gracilibacillus caseinilyticus TaxID=2932256 RepID=A0ABY4EYE5_9BACI|nr:CAP domain-containing protein [Gracilibacillus caseinilyticus]UOQ49288.1 CAP domain-containing protein [Gracilibacillus caseinilyticus]